MKKIDIPVLSVIAILIGTISLCLFLFYGLKLLAYPPLELATLTESNLKAGRYVQGTISDCYTYPVGNNNLRVGREGEYIMMGLSYTSYTIPVWNDHYIRVWICDKADQKKMEQIVQGDPAEVVFAGQIKKMHSSLNTAFYSKDPNFDQSKVVADYEIWQKSPVTDRNLCLASLFGLVIAAMLYHSSGGIRRIEVEVKAQHKISAGRAVVRDYDAEYELISARRRLERYKEKERENRREGIIGLVCIVIGGVIDFVLQIIELKLVGLVFIIFGVKKCWVSFINSNNKYAVKIALLFSVTTLQAKRAAEESRIMELEQEIREE